MDLRSVLYAIVHRTSQAHPVEVSYQAQKTLIRARQADLEMAFSNMIENAQRYSPAGVPVRVMIRDAEGGLTISVADDGPGIPEARHDKVFERFYTTEADRGGTGLGLAIVDSVARAHGGRVTLRRGDGRGTCFDFWLPSLSG
jgi:two-component system, OmpR family, sensor histidine kinase ChvG